MDDFPLDAKFFEDMITDVFGNIENSGKGIHGGTRYSFYGRGGYKGHITLHCNITTTTIYIDNYPGPKKYYRTEVPILTFGDFKRLLECCGYNELTLK